ncbi:MAG: hypothetical protein LBF22_08165 [Deltaproteobacteria bacterium]|nr:hypothetical protein [Deltaproteobacteria bacterium]
MHRYIFILGEAIQRNFDSQRPIKLGANFETLKVNYHANSCELFVDASFSFNVGDLSTLEQYLSLGWMGIWC